MSLSCTSIRALGIWYKKLRQAVAISFTRKGYLRLGACGVVLRWLHECAELTAVS
jgi:hypothetical protein